MINIAIIKKKNNMMTNGKNQYLQPTHNQYLRKMRKAPKRQKY